VDSTEAELVDAVFARGDPALEIAGGRREPRPFLHARGQPVRRSVSTAWMLGPGSCRIHHLVPDRTRPMDFEVHSVETVQGFGSGREAQRDFKPLFMPRSTPQRQRAWLLHRAPRAAAVVGAAAPAGATLGSYVGDEVYLSLVDGRHGAYPR
jgi:type VI secretion system protein ImpG